MEKLHVTFLEEAPEKELVAAIVGRNFGEDQFELIDREVYVHCPGGLWHHQIEQHILREQIKGTCHYTELAHGWGVGKDVGRRLIGVLSDRGKQIGRAHV